MGVDVVVVGRSRLIDVVAGLDAASAVEHDRARPSPTIFARRPWTAESDAMVLTDEAVNGMASSALGYAYLLEVDLAQEVLEVWSSWRHDEIPTPEAATLAIIYYAEHDAYEPVE